MYTIYWPDSYYDKPVRYSFLKSHRYMEISLVLILKMSSGNKRSYVLKKPAAFSSRFVQVRMTFCYKQELIKGLRIILACWFRTILVTTLLNIY